MCAGHIYDSKTDTMTRYFQPTWWDPTNVPSAHIDYKLIRTSLERSVRKRLMAEVPYGVLLSGGLDSSLVASIAQRETLRAASVGKVNGYQDHEQKSSEDLVGMDDNDELSTVPWLGRLHSFSIGLPDAPDTKAALEVAKFLGTKHYDFSFTIEDGLNALSDVIFHLETYDVTTIRASTPMFLLSRKIKAMGVKMVLSGEGSDEIFGGYLYFHAAPDKEALHAETVRRVKNLHLSDCLRANKSTAAWGVEARVPFLDKEVSFAVLAFRWDLTNTVHGKRHERRSSGKDDNQGPNRKVYSTQSFRYYRRAGYKAISPRQHPLAPEGAIQ